MPLQALIFDMDGLLTDTEPLHMQAYVEVVNRHGLPLTEAAYAAHWIVDGLGIAEYLEKLGSTLDPAVLRAEKAVIYDALAAEQLRPMPGAVELVQRFHGRLPLAVGSANWRKNVLVALKGTGLLTAMDAVIAKDDVARGKPAPDIFLAAAAALGIPPANCLVLEDAAKGVLAAERAGMSSLAIPTAWTKDNDFSAAAAVLDSLDAAGEWIERRLSADT